LTWPQLAEPMALPRPARAALLMVALIAPSRSLLLGSPRVAPPTMSETATVSNPATAMACRVRVSHILVDSEDLANKCRDMLSSGETEFPVLAETVSTCDSNARGGDLGWITPGLMVPEFDAAAFYFPPGELTTVKSEFGWHVVRVAEASYLELEMPPAELAERLGEGDGDKPALQLIDIREEEELEKATVSDAPFRHLPYNKWQTWAEEAIAGTLEPPIRADAELLFMDHRGGRGERMAQYFMQNGFTKSRYLRGGINAYAEEADPRVPTYLESDGDCLTCHEH